MLKPILLTITLLFSVVFADEKPTLTDAEINTEWNDEARDIYNLFIAKFSYSQALYGESVDSLYQLAKQEESNELYSKALGAAIRSSQYELALEITESWQEINSNPLDAYKIYILILLEKVDDAVALTKTYLQKSSNKNIEKERINNLIAMLQKNWDKESVVSYIKNLADLYPDDKEITYFYSNLLRFNGQPDEAVAQIDKLLFNEPKNIDLHLLKSDIYRFDLQIDKANAIWQRLLEDYPSEQMFRFRYAQFLYDSYQFEKCIDELNNITLSVVSEQKKVLLAMAMLRLNKLTEAETVFDFANLPEEALDKAYFQFANFLTENKKYAEATYYLKKINEDGEQGLDAQLMLVSNTYRNNIKAGNSLFQALANQHQIEGLDAINYQGFALEKAERYAEAVNLYSDFLGKEGKNIDALYRRSLAYDMLGEGDKAIADLQRILEIDPWDDSAKNALGYTMIIYNKHIDDAVKLIENALFDDPWSAAVVDSMGWGRFYQKNYTDANKYLYYSYSNMIDGEVIGHYIRSLYASGNVDKAKKLYQLESKYLKDDKKLEKYIAPIKNELID